MQQRKGVDWQNEYDKDLFMDCYPSGAFYRVRSEHSNYYEDRRWRWDCKDVSVRQARIDCMPSARYIC